MIDLKNTQQPKLYKTLLIGDDCLDVYQFGTVDRISPEAPVPVFKMGTKEERPGMARNVKSNLESLGCEVTYFSGKTSVKTRLIESRSKQQICRIDNDRVSQPLAVTDISHKLQDFDVIVISDYNKGYVSYELISYLRHLFHGPIFLDTKKTDLAMFNGIHVKINEVEYNNCKSVNDSLIVTLGSRGAMYKTPNGQTFYTTPLVEVSDVCGAGDTFLAALTYQYMVSKEMSYSIEFANRAAAITVQHIGNYSPSLEEIS